VSHRHWFWRFCSGLVWEKLLRIAPDRLLNNVVSTPYKTLRKDCVKPEKPHLKRSRKRTGDSVIAPAGYFLQRL